MLENLPSMFGHALRGVHPSTKHLLLNQAELEAPLSLDVRSPAFEAGSLLPVRCTADGQRLSPAVTWMDVPEHAASIALIIEDADSPTFEPLVHAIAFNFEGRDGMLAEGELPNARYAAGWPLMGINSALASTYMPPDPPPGHGRHRYVLELFALDRKLDFDAAPGRNAMLQAMRGHVLAKGCIVGTYERC